MLWFLGVYFYLTDAGAKCACGAVPINLTELHSAAMIPAIALSVAPTVALTVALYITLSIPLAIALAVA